MTYAEVQIERDRRAVRQQAAKIENTQRQIRQSMNRLQRQCAILEDPALLDKELNARVVQFAMREQAAGRKVNYSLARQMVVNGQDRPEPKNRPTSSRAITEATMRYASSEINAGRPCTFECAKLHVLAG